MSAPFDIMTPAKSGYLGLEADRALQKKKRGEILAGAVQGFDEKTKGRRNYQAAWPSDPANALLLRSDPAKNAPRGSSASWTFGVPATRDGANWRPMQRFKLGDKDFLTVAAKILGPRDAVLFETTGHTDHETVALVGGTNIRAHHLNSPPPESSLVHDIDAQGQPDAVRNGGLHYTLRVRQMPEQFCTGKKPKLPNGEKDTAPPDKPTPGAPLRYAPMLNFTRNGDGTRADGIMHFANEEAVGSHEAFGFMRPSAPKHTVGFGEAPIRQLAFDIDRGVFGDGSDPWSAPFLWVRDKWAKGSRGPFIRDVETRMNFGATHATLCGSASGMWQEMSWKDKETPTETPPPTTPPKTPPPVTGPPGTPVFPPPGVPTFNSGEPVLDEKHRIKLPAATERPTNSGPNEEEQPSQRGVAFPDEPDGPKGVGAAAFDIFEGDEAWDAAYGIPHAQARFWAAGRVSHDVAQGVYTSDAPLKDGGPRWKQVLAKSGTMRFDIASGRWYGKRGYGTGFQTLMPGGVEGHMAYKARNGSKLTASQTLTRLFLNYAIDPVTATPFIETKFAVGARKEDVDTVVSGFDIGLDYSASTAEPDALITFRDAEGGPVAGQRLLNADGEVFAYLSDIGAGTGDMTAEGTDGDDFAGAGLLLTANGNNKTAKDTGIYVDPATNDLVSPANIQAVDIEATGVLDSGLHTIRVAVGDPIRTEISAATNDDPTEITYHGRGTTSENGTLDLFTLSPTSGYRYTIRATVNTRQTSGAGTGTGRTHDIVADVENIGGTITVTVVSNGNGGTLAVNSCTILYDALAGVVVRISVESVSGSGKAYVHHAFVTLYGPLGT